MIIKNNPIVDFTANVLLEIKNDFFELLIIAKSLERYNFLHFLNIAILNYRKCTFNYWLCCAKVVLI
ncbi:hypothetical protein GCM10023189_50570 [Nibrella saemangeumensis]|uniref:Uncharacterized protein n=1 Tax=Nibrella saemangeumensis TaxID=1084526 RepID=A0ABP8NL96_9BACT